MREAVAESTWHIWLERVSLTELDGTTFVLAAPDDVRSWLETRFGRLLLACAQAAIGPEAQVRIAAGDADEPEAAAARPSPADRSCLPRRSSTRG